MRKQIKRLIDFCLSFLGIIILSPLFFLIALLVKIDSKGPVFFRQERLGRNGKAFIMLKFRSMVEGAENIGLGLGVTKDDTRITKVGKYLRKWTLDELPQFINVLKGKMSLVGPRPLPKSYLKKFNDFQRKRLLVKPGMISLVDVRGRDLVSWEKRFELDVWYIENWSLWLDLKILLSIPFVVFSRKGIYGKEGINKPFSEDQ
jgi:lipopolysaccharide/colanic/teichoic acid biosynthesis glycosyltransferase